MLSPRNSKQRFPLTKKEKTGNTLNQKARQQPWDRKGKHMEAIKSVKIYLNNADEVWKFVNIIRKFSGDYDLAAGSYTVDAKSILGVCALGTKKPLELKLVDPRGEENSLLTALDQYLIRE